MSKNTQNVGILGIGSAAPEKVLTNFDLEKMVETNDEWIRTRTGIKERRIRAEGEAASDIGHLAAQKALEDAGLGPEDVDLIICATFTPDEMIPSSACRIQQKFGVNGSAAFDINAACTGFVYALTVAKNMIRGGAARRAGGVGAEVISSGIDY